jgi:hypothetical protein
MPDDVPLRQQLQCARRELALRVRVYPRLVANETMLQSTATKELAAMSAIVRTLARLVAAEDGAGGQAALFGEGKELKTEQHE